MLNPNLAPTKPTTGYLKNQTKEQHIKSAKTTQTRHVAHLEFTAYTSKQINNSLAHKMGLEFLPISVPIRQQTQKRRQTKGVDVVVLLLRRSSDLLPSSDISN
jgi:hypothetical protein